ncbi:MAG: ComEC/Rec2 family competence protein [Saprospiraceae bacterium]|nr:ComEC/Rec2 family competence protein [Saprospiraceae bacterium]
MIEYTLARPFIILSILSAIVYSLVEYCYFNIEINKFYPFIIVLVLFLISLWYQKKKAYLSLFLFAILVFSSRKLQHLNEKHTNQEISDNTNLENQTIHVIKSQTFNNLNIIDGNLQIGNKLQACRIKIPTRYLTEKLFYNDTLKCAFTLHKIKSYNSRYFSAYNEYLLKSHIQYHGILTDSVVQISKSKQLSLQNTSQIIADKIKLRFLQNIPDSSNAFLLISLLIGEKQQLDATIKEAFISTGTAHILAVSGLHLGILYILLFQAFKVFRFFPALNYKIIAFLGIIISIWLFAFITGLSASVLRAAIMLSFMEFGKLLGRETDSVNSLFGCSFVMLYYDPCTLYDVGFQLSFFAVLSILLFNPYIQRLYVPGNFITSKLWELISVSISVQFLVTPISIYYFQQFPLYFLFSNLLWIPLSFILMIIGLILIITSSFLPLISLKIGLLASLLCDIGMNGLYYIRKIPSSVLQNLWLYPEQIIAYTIICILLFFGMQYKNQKYYFVGLTLSLLIPIILAIRFVNLENSSQLILYKEKSTLQFDLRIGRTIYTTNPTSKLMLKLRSSNLVSNIIAEQKIENLNQILKVYKFDKFWIHTTTQNNSSNFEFCPINRSSILEYDHPFKINSDPLLNLNNSRKTVIECQQYSDAYISTYGPQILNLISYEEE